MDRLEDDLARDTDFEQGCRGDLRKHLSGRERTIPSWAAGLASHGVARMGQLTSTFGVTASLKSL